MKKKKWMALAMMLVLVFFAACDTKEAAVAVAGTVEMETQAVSPRIAGTCETGVSYTHSEPVEMVVYYSNGRADGLEREILGVGEITPEEIMEGLSRHNIVSMDTKVLDFVEETDGQGRTVLGLDLSKAFGEYLKTMGESGEKVILAALTNTFLENYQADGLLLTVEGGKLETGYGVYEDRLTYTDSRGK